MLKVTCQLQLEPKEKTVRCKLIIIIIIIIVIVIIIIIITTTTLHRLGHSVCMNSRTEQKWSGYCHTNVFIIPLTTCFGPDRPYQEMKCTN
jgi:flagellar basal body-associated protein FliL